jgi:hypothetical protein
MGKNIPERKKSIPLKILNNSEYTFDRRQAKQFGLNLQTK